MNAIRNKVLAAFLAVSSLGVAGATSSTSDNYQIDWQVFDPGGHSGIDSNGEQRASESFVVQDSLAQPVAQSNWPRPSSDSYQLESGY